MDVASALRGGVVTRSSQVEGVESGGGGLPGECFAQILKVAGSSFDTVQTDDYGFGFSLDVPMTERELLAIAGGKKGVGGRLG